MSGLPVKATSTTAVTTDSDVHAQLSAVDQDQTMQEPETVCETLYPYAGAETLQTEHLLRFPKRRPRARQAAC